MHSKRIAFIGSKDLISCLPDDLSCHILSFLTTKEAVSTSLLSKRWKNLFASLPNLEFDDSVFILDSYVDANRTYAIPMRFMNFVDSVLALQGNAQLNRFHLRCSHNVYPYQVFEWILIVLERGVSDLDLNISTQMNYRYSWSKIFMSKTLARLKLKHRNGSYGVIIDVEDEIFLPKLKILHLESVRIKNSMFVKLLSGCPELEELVLIEMMRDSSEQFTLSSTTLKRLKFRRIVDSKWSTRSMSFDIPNLVYLEYIDCVSLKYPQVNFDSLVEASLGFRLTDAQAEDVEASRKIVSDSVTNFLKGICNVKILYLFHDTIEVLNFCCKTVPVFKNLIHVTIKTHQVRWKSLIALLKSSPNLETLIFEISHTSLKSKLLKQSNRKYSVDNKDKKDIPTFLSSCSVKVLKILKFGEICDYNCDKMVNLVEQIKQIKYLLKTMPNLEEMILNCDTSTDVAAIGVSSQLQRLSKIASPKCKVQVISKNQRISFTIPSSTSTT